MPEGAADGDGQEGGAGEMGQEGERGIEDSAEESGGDIGYDDDGDDPTEDEFEDAAAEDGVGVAGDVEEIVIAEDEALGANDPEGKGDEAKHDRVMDRDAEGDGRDVHEDLERAGGEMH